MGPPSSIYIAFDVFPRPKGSSSHIASVVAALGRKHSPVWLLCLGYGDMPARQTEGDVVIHRYKIYHPNLLKRAAGFAEFVAEKTARAGAAVELCVFRDPWGGVPALIALPEGAAAVFEVNALPSWELPYLYPALHNNFALLAKLRDQERFCLRESDGIFTVSGVTREALAGLGIDADRIAVVPNSAAEVFFNADPRNCPWPELSSGDWFGYVGSLHPWQGLDTALTAFARVAEDLPAARMLVAHSGRKTAGKIFEKRARKLGLADRVIFHGPLSPEHLASTLGRLRFTVAPLTETLRNTVQGCCPVKIIESLAAGTPVLASDLRVCREILNPGQDSLLVPAGDPREWARAMRRLFTEPGLAERLARGARASAKKSFAQETIHDRLDLVFARAAQQRNQPRMRADERG